ncbi:MAG: PA14 domain-containing protein, partial [Anaerolineae bacterium]
MFLKSLRRFLFAVAAFAVVFMLTGVAPASAAGVSVSPRAGGYGTSFTVSATGFPSNSIVDTWVTRPDGQTVGLGTVRADAGGNVSFGVTPAYTWPAGEYIAVAHARSGAVQVFVKFGFNAAPPPVGQDSGVTVAASATGLSVSPNSGTYSTVFVVSGSGFAANETVAVWAVAPGGSIVGPGYVTTNSSGAFQLGSSVPWGYPAGQYTLYAQGQSSSHKSSTSFTLTVPASTGYFTSPWTGYYYANASLSGSPVLTRTDAQLNFDWAGTSPGAGVPATDWSAKWDSTQYAPADGNYTVHVTADDGVRVWIDGNLVIDEWQNQPAATYSATGWLA